MLAALFLMGLIAVTAQGQAPEAGQKGPPPGAAKEGPYAKPYPMGFVTINLTKVGAVVGAEWGSGVLTYKGKQYTFKVRGMQLASVGISKATLKGDVYNLFGLAEFPGQYAAVAAGGAIIKGTESSDYRNLKNVHIVLKGTEKGLNLSIGPKGFYIELEEAM